MQEQGKPIPETCRDKPTIQQENMLAWKCWNDLCADRETGRTIGWIRFSSIDTWARRYGITSTFLFEDLRRLVQAMDVVYVEHLQKELKQKANNA